MKFILNLPNVQVLGKDELKQIKGGNYIYSLNGYKIDCAKPLVDRPSCDPFNIPPYCSISPNMCPVIPPLEG
ncbi:hypothetical protein FLA105534_03496 [Flavobacterium bizetiae]|uniref:Uncharacterized protein n=1 Tax=Flavobacterium bizetiae TaxID=2704140 RepID=A0A6J4GPR1_9FLAO|nr:hypothetical protein FLA105534_03496 [Flavobacterium bizetiae]CAD5340506.1 hypothetical protein FLA105535_00461 [Flavobacterium bizetiae]CAD5346911.1 hypothetical protein FLA105534_00855 [Flavobacterium bizetiae]